MNEINWLFRTSDYEAMRANMGKEPVREHTVGEGFEDCDYRIKNRE